jgi:hypothetical protein
MSRDTYAICRACGVYQPDDGLNATLVEVGTVAGFDEELQRRFNMTPADLPADHVNRRIRAFVERHEPHGEVEFWSSDWQYDEDDPLEGLAEVEPPRGAPGPAA